MGVTINLLSTRDNPNMRKSKIIIILFSADSNELIRINYPGIIEWIKTD